MVRLVILAIVVWLGLSGISILTAGVVSYCGPQPRTNGLLWHRQQPRNVIALTASEQALFDALNEFRRRHGRRPLVIEPHLQATARSRTNATFMGGHRVNGKMPMTDAKRHGYPGRSVGENLAWGGATPHAAVFGQWGHSPGHYRNQLSNWKYVGVGVRGRTYVADFGN